MINEYKYLDLVEHVIRYGDNSSSRAGDTTSMPGMSLKLDLRDGFPLLTTRRIFTQGVFGELAAFVRGAEDLATFEKFGCNYWEANAATWSENHGKPREEWKIGRSYGSLWRNFNGVDQLVGVLDSIKSDPHSRRHVVSAWDPSAKACLPSCHIMFQFYVRDGYLSCHVYMRSVDLCVGLPSDILLYATLLCLVAKDTGLTPAKLVFSFGDAHVYQTHVKQFMEEQLKRPVLSAPDIIWKKDTTTLTFEPDDIEIVNYSYAPPIKYQFMP